jgi:hypothetical protein
MDRDRASLSSLALWFIAREVGDNVNATTNGRDDDSWSVKLDLKTFRMQSMVTECRISEKQPSIQVRNWHPLVINTGREESIR